MDEPKIEHTENAEVSINRDMQITAETADLRA